MPGKVWDEITYPFTHVNSCTVDAWEWCNDFIPHFTMDTITHFCWDSIIQFSEIGPCSLTLNITRHFVQYHWPLFNNVFWSAKAYSKSLLVPPCIVWSGLCRRNHEKFRKNGSMAFESLRSLFSVQQSVVLWHMRCSWWRHQMVIFFALLARCEGNPLVTGGFPSQRTVTRSFYVFFDLHLNKRCANNRDPSDLRRWRIMTSL